MSESMFVIIGCDYTNGQSKVIGIASSLEKAQIIHTAFPELIYNEFIIDDFGCTVD